MSMNRRFHIAVFDQFVSAGGVRRFTLAMLRSWLRLTSPEDYRFTLFWPDVDTAGLPLSLPFDPMPPHLEVEALPAIPRRRGVEWLAGRTDRFDLVYFPSTVGMLSLDREVGLACPAVATLHDLAHEFTTAWGEEAGWVRREAQQWARFADALIFSSDHIRENAERLYRIPQERTHRIYLAPPLFDADDPSPDRVAEVRRHYGLPERFALSPGTAMIHKNPHTIIEGFARMKRNGCGVPLVLVGPMVENLVPGRRGPSVSRYHISLQRQVEECGMELDRDLFILGHVPDSEMSALYLASSLVVTASVSEAGLNGPIFEAMWHRRPVVCTSIPQFVERLGTDDRYVYMFDPGDAEGLRRAIERWASDPEGAARRVEDARRWVGQRTWDDSAREYLDLFRSVYSRRVGETVQIRGDECRPLHGHSRESENDDSDLLRIERRGRETPRHEASAGRSPDPRTVRIKWAGCMLDFSGYARLSRDTLRTLDRRNAPLSIEPLGLDQRFLQQMRGDTEETRRWRRLLGSRGSGDVYVCFHPPVLWDGTDVFETYRGRNPRFKAYVGITMFETDRLPAGWAAACNGMDEVWVPCRFNLETFANSGVDPDRLRVIPFGIDTGAFDPKRVRPLLKPSGEARYTFLSIFQWSKRKGWDVLLKAYLSAFSADDRVCLLLRTYPDRIKTPPIRERLNNYIEELGYDGGGVPPIVLIEDFVPEEKMPALYASADAFVLPSRGEGWGIPYMEAMAMGLPTIGTRWSGHLDFMNDENSYLIDMDALTPVSPDQTAENPFYTPDQRWAEPSVEHTAQLMRHLFEHRNEARAKGERARRQIQANWSLDRTADWVLARAAELAGRSTSTAVLRSAGSDDRPNPAAGQASRAVVWHGPIYDPSGYADEARHFVMHLQAGGVPIAARAIGRHSAAFRKQLQPEVRRVLDRALAEEGRPGSISVVHFPAYAFQRVPGAAYHIGRTMFETDSLPPEWVAKCNQMDEVWVPTEFNLQTFKAAGVTSRLFKVPGGIDVARFRPGLDPLPIPGARGTIYLSVFEWGYRKGWDVLLRAWAEAFSPAEDVTLVLRTYPANATDDAGGRQEIERRIDRYLAETLGIRRDQAAPIVVLGDQIAEEDMPRLFAAAGAYVAPSRGEGWGRPQMEAMACGLPVIATRWSGNLEFMTDQNSLLLDVKGLVEVDHRADNPVYRGQRWAEPSVDHLVTLLRRVVERPEEVARLGCQAREDVARLWSWESAATIAAERLQAIEAELEGRSRGLAPKPEGPLAIRWEGAQFVHHSLALVNRELALQLIAAGHEVSLVPERESQFGPEVDPRFSLLARRFRAPLSRGADIHVRHQWPPNFTPPPEGRWVMIQPWEFGSLPIDWIEAMREQVDEVWTYTSFVRDCYIESGMPPDRVQVVPIGVRTDRFRPGVTPMRLPTEKRFKFLFVGGTIRRKAPEVLLGAYLDAFTSLDDVCLVVKDMGGSSFYQGQTMGEQIRGIQATPGAPEILYLTEDMAPDDMPALYAACDCLVHPYRGEGFGLPIAEAMACGLPVIVTGAGACLDFCDESVAYLIPARKVQFPEKRVDRWATAGTPFWYEPDQEATAQLMRRVFENPGEARALGARASRKIHQQFNWENAAKRATERMRALLQRPVARSHRPRPRPLAAVPAEVNQRLSRGRAALEAGKLEEAVEEFACVTRLLPDLPEGHAALGSILLALHRTEEAISELRRAAQLSPRSASLRNQLGVALFQGGDQVGAEEEFRQAAGLGSGDVQPLLNLIDLYRLQGRYGEATGAVKEALRLDPSHVDVLAAFGTLSLELGDLEGGEMAIRRIEMAQPGHEMLDALRRGVTTLRRALEETRGGERHAAQAGSGST